MYNIQGESYRLSIVDNLENISSECKIENIISEKSVLYKNLVT